MKQLALSGIPRFAEGPADAPYEQVIACRSEAEAVRWSLDFAREALGLNRQAIAKLCGWKRPSFLSEIASEGSEKRMPEARVGRFVLATGTRLLEQWLERKTAEARVSGKSTEADRAHQAVAAMLASARRAA